MEKKILKFVNVFSQFCNYLPLEKGVALDLIKLEFLSPKECFAPSLVKIGPAVLEKKILKIFVNVISHFRNYLPLKKGVAFHLIKLESPSPKDALLPSLVEIGPVVLEKKMKMWKVYDNNDNDDNANNNDDDGQRKNFNQKSSLEPSAQVS